MPYKYSYRALSHSQHFGRVSKTVIHISTILVWITMWISEISIYGVIYSSNFTYYTHPHITHLLPSNSPYIFLLSSYPLPFSLISSYIHSSYPFHSFLFSFYTILSPIPIPFYIFILHYPFRIQCMYILMSYEPYYPCHHMSL
jgi:hypothetical protein